jgi:hypothetical protein
MSLISRIPTNIDTSHELIGDREYYMLNRTWNGASIRYNHCIPTSELSCLDLSCNSFKVVTLLGRVGGKLSPRLDPKKPLPMATQRPGFFFWIPPNVTYWSWAEKVRALRYLEVQFDLEQLERILGDDLDFGRINRPSDPRQRMPGGCRGQTIWGQSCSCISCSDSQGAKSGGGLERKRSCAMATEAREVLHRGVFPTEHQPCRTGEPHASLTITFRAWIPDFHGCTAVLMGSATPHRRCRTSVGFHRHPTLGDRGPGRVCRSEPSDQSIPKSTGDDTRGVATRSKEVG